MLLLLLVSPLLTGAHHPPTQQLRTALLTHLGLSQAPDTSKVTSFFTN